jgi:hypothetical protein
VAARAALFDLRLARGLSALGAGRHADAYRLLRTLFERSELQRTPQSGDRKDGVPRLAPRHVDETARPLRRSGMLTYCEKVISEWSQGLGDSR